MTTKTLICVVGARPNFMKIAPVIRALQQTQGRINPYLVHTGQHYDQAMKTAFFEQLGIPEPDIDLEVGSGSHAQQTAQVMLRFEPVLDKVKPFAILVVGDVNSTIACSLVAVKKNIPIIHVEAGLRSGDLAMPEEINRILTDQISRQLFLTERSAQANLEREGINESRIHFVGNVMIDTLLANVEKSLSVQEILENHQQAYVEKYALLTMHRPSNVDEPETLKRLLTVLAKISQKLPIIFPVHPRTAKQIQQFGFTDLIESANFLCLPPVSYLEIVGLMKSATCVLTDSGGLQEETTALGVPCVTLRENTERPITIDQGTNTIAGTDPEKILACVNDVLATGGKTGCVPEYWDGHAATRIVKIIEQELMT